MSGVTFTLDRAEMQKTLSAMADRIRDRGPLLRSIGALARESVRTNFAAGGRPVQWRPLKRRRGQPLRDTGRLQNSVTSRVEGDVVLVGTNVRYAALHHFGARKGTFGEHLVQVRAHRRQARSGGSVTVRAHARRMRLPWGDIPARPFMLLQESDRVEIRALCARYVMEGK